MPLRSYHSQRNPPSFVDHTLAHPWEVLCAAFAIINGALGMVSLSFNGETFTAAADTLPSWTAGLMCIALAVGGMFVLAGIYDEHDDLMVGYVRERLGLFVSGTAWIVYAAVAGFAFPLFLGWRFGILLAAASALRLFATYREERRLRNPIEGLPSPLITGVIGSAQAAASEAQVDASAAQATAMAAQDLAAEAMAAAQEPDPDEVADDDEQA
jgi:hypothetical protein